MKLTSIEYGIAMAAVVAFAILGSRFAAQMLVPPGTPTGDFTDQLKLTGEPDTFELPPVEIASNCAGNCADHLVVPPRPRVKPPVPGQLHRCSGTTFRDQCVQTPTQPMLFPRSSTGRWNYLVQTYGGQIGVRVGFKTRRECEAELFEDLHGMPESRYRALADFARELHSAANPASAACQDHPEKLMCTTGGDTYMKTRQDIFVAECFK